MLICIVRKNKECLNLFISGSISTFIPEILFSEKGTGWLMIYQKLVFYWTQVNDTFARKLNDNLQNIFIPLFIKIYWELS
jgi:hypothetical protein